LNVLKQIIQATTGYWIHKLNTLPIGTDLFYDITKRLKYGNLHTVFDVGANEGQTLKWIRFYQPAAKIYSFEPVRSTFDILKSNVVNYPDCVLEKLALGEAKGQKKIKIFPASSVLNSLNEYAMYKGADAIEEVITVDTLDNYCFEKTVDRIDFLKIDTEGYELNVLLGAEKLLAEKRISFIYSILLLRNSQIF
jgi:FkbM family methyltransferase